MSKLTGPEIAAQWGAGKIVIEPYDPRAINPNSYDLRLAPHLLVYEEAVLDPSKQMRTRHITIPKEGLVLEPGRLYLGLTHEIAGSTEYMPSVDGKSSLGRLGLFIHVTAGFGDVGFVNRWTLEFVAVQAIRIYAGMKIGQISFSTVVGERMQYRGSYGQQRIDSLPVASRMWEKFDVVETEP